MTSETSADTQTMIPECKIPATVNPNGMLRFEVSQSQTEQLLQQTRANFKTVADDELVTFTINLDRDSYKEMVTGLQKLANGLPTYGAKQINLAPNPEYAMSVLLSEDQIQTGAEQDTEEIRALNDDEVLSQQFQMSKKAAYVVIKQLESVLDGSETPIENLDMEQIKREY